jgi:hypothetical protein
MLLEPGAIAQPMNDTIDGPTRRALRAWNVSDAEEIKGASTACTSDNAFGTHVPVSVLLRSLSI